MGMESDAELVRAAQGGSRGAYGRLVERYAERALSLAYAWTRNYDEAKDLSQEAFLKAFESLSRFRGASTFYTWFCRILINLGQDYGRRQGLVGRLFQRSGRDEAREPDRDIFEEIADPGPGPREALRRKELNERLTGAIEALPGKQRAVFVLKHLQGLKITEISEITGTAPGTIKHQLWQAVTALQQHLDGYLEPEDR